MNEIELKLRIASIDIPRLKRHKAIKQTSATKPRTRKLTSIYFDTPDLQLLKANVSLRVRRMSGGWFQSVKTAGNVTNGLHSRMEWEDKLSSSEPDFKKLSEPAIVKLFSNQLLRDALRPIFITEVKRTEWQLKTSNGHIELALDVGALIIGGVHKAEICEIELELKSGDAAQLFAFAEKLKRNIQLLPENTSKAELGYQYYQAQ